jgi:DNA-binding MarR family transcriptional regulator
VKAIHNVPDTADGRATALERLWAVAILLGAGMETGLAERGLTLARSRLVWQLQQAGPSTQQALSRALRTTPRNITGLVDALEADGVVARKAHPSDRRATLVSLTAKGASLARAMRRDQDDFAQRVFEGMTPADLSKFTTVLDRVLGRIKI